MLLLRFEAIATNQILLLQKHLPHLHNIKQVYLVRVACKTTGSYERFVTNSQYLYTTLGFHSEAGKKKVRLQHSLFTGRKVKVRIQHPLRILFYKYTIRLSF